MFLVKKLWYYKLYNIIPQKIKKKNKINKLDCCFYGTFCDKSHLKNEYDKQKINARAILVFPLM